MSILMRSRTRRSLLSTKMISTPSSTETRLLRLLRLRRRCETTHSVWVRILLHRTTSEHSERMSWWWHVTAISTRALLLEKFNACILLTIGSSLELEGVFPSLLLLFVGIKRTHQVRLSRTLTSVGIHRIRATCWKEQACCCCCCGGIGACCCDPPNIRCMGTGASFQNAILLVVTVPPVLCRHILGVNHSFVIGLPSFLFSHITG